MDFITGLPKSEGKSVIMVVVDRLATSAHFCSLSHPCKASIVSTTFMETIQNLHGNPKIIVSDRDPILLEIFGRNYFFKLLNRSSWNLRYTFLSTKIKNLKFIWRGAEILRKFVKKFQSSVHNIFGDMI